MIRRYPDCSALPRLRLRVLFRKAEQFLAARKRDAAATLVAEIARRPEDLGEATGTYLLALEWAASPPATAGDLLGSISTTAPLKGRRCNWLNLSALAKTLLPTYTIPKIRYFTALVEPSAHDCDQHLMAFATRVTSLLSFQTTPTWWNLCE